MSLHLDDHTAQYAGIQDITPSVMPLISRSTRNQHGNCIPILATVYLYRILQFSVFIFCPCTRTSSRQGDTGIQDIVPSAITLISRSTWNQRGNCSLILATVHSYCILQFAVFIFCPCTRTSSRQGDAGIQGILPSVITLFLRSTWDQRGNSIPILATVYLHRILQFAVFVF
jgi:hypothetical protein